MLASLKSTLKTLLPVVDRSVYRVAGLFPAPRGEYHVLLPAPGGGNIGDQAMLDSYVENVAGRITVVVSEASALNNPEPGRVSFLTLPGLIRLRGFRHWRSIAEMSRVTRGAKSFTVTGADIMDGGYDANASIVRWNLLACAASSGVPSRVLGFSWNGKAPKQVRAIANRAHKDGVVLYVRDPISLERIRSDGLFDAIGVSDSVFALSALSESFYESEWIVERLGRRRIAIVNASALVAKSLDVVAELRIVVAELLSAGFDVVVLPHVNRGSRGDVYECRRVAYGWDDDRVLSFDRLLAPAAVRWLVRHSDLVVSGRMHLAIMALSQGTPAIIVATQGKVEGLAQMFDIPQMLVDPIPGMGRSIVERLDSATSNEWAVKISARLPRLVELSARNFEGLS